jgi:hypothetical protein
MPRNTGELDAPVYSEAGVGCVGVNPLSVKVQGDSV